ncbi:MAG TPA: HNH endonuclease signature motif containing protein [Pyrinomonadaceae bacterium]|nr:HNH endonuclease signature motif containing protein [Pyrinomonadaceae bacterium]
MINKRQAKIIGDHAELPLTKGKVALIDIEDVERVCQWNWQFNFDNKKKCKSYAWTAIKMKRVRLHRFLLNAPDGFEVDHKNGNGLDNRKSNLRIATRSQNAANGSYQNQSGFRGVYQFGKLFMANIRFNNKTIHLGRFSTKTEAAKAYDAKAKQLFGEFATLNFPD